MGVLSNWLLIERVTIGRWSIAVETCRALQRSALTVGSCVLTAGLPGIWTCHGRTTSSRMGFSSFEVPEETLGRRSSFRISFATVTRQWSSMTIASQPVRYFSSSRRIRHMYSEAVLSSGTIPWAQMPVVPIAPLWMCLLPEGPWSCNVDHA